MREAEKLVTNLYIARHGQTAWNEEHRIQGMLDSPLTKAGKEQASMLGRFLSGTNLNTIYSSSSKRAVHTAEIVNSFQDEHCKLIEEDDLREIGLGEWEGMKRAEVTQLYPSLQDTYFNDPENFEPVGNGETFLEVKERALGVLGRILAMEKGKNILILSHSAVVKILMAHFDGRPFSRLWNPPRVKQASLSHIQISQTDHLILKYADTSFLRARGINNLK